MSWTVIALMIAGSYGFKALGVFGLAGDGSNRVAKRAQPLTALIPAALFSAIIVVQTFGNERSVIIDARLVGLVVAIVAVRFKAPFIVVVVAAMIATAVVRAAGG